MPNPLISINIPVFNGEKFLEKALQSVLDQTYKDYEIVIIIDGTNDKSEEIIKKYQKLYPEKIRYQWQKNLGLARTRNNLIKLSKGDYIAILDQDDLWKKDKLEKQMSLFSKDPEVKFVYSSFTFIDDNDDPVNDFQEKLYRGFFFDEYFNNYFIPCPTIIFNKDIIDKVGFFDPAYKYAEETDFALKASLFYKFDYVPESTCFYRLHEHNTSKNDILTSYEHYKLKKNIYKFIKKNKLSLKNVVPIKKEIWRLKLVYIRTMLKQSLKNILKKGSK
ncbi:glycosyltransferase family 2 protein [Candidatus Margulisiibacteriota bacterium]